MVTFLVSAVILLSLPFLVSSPKTTVVLLDNNKEHNAIDVTTEGGKVALDKPYMLTSLSTSTAKPQPVTQGDETLINEKYKDTLAPLPHMPTSMLFYFEEGSDLLVPESKEQIGSLVQLIKTEEPCIVDIIGHSDTVGTAESNFELALKRAQTLKLFLEDNNVTMKKVNVQSYGESDPLIPTGDN
ncbi:MAG: OmpA family protein, partial [Sulfuricurvum sp.]|nr:OmpA family protein [Sulfuricurvum sp.]